MSDQIKIYDDDPNCPYKSTKLGALYTRTDIDGLLAKWGIKKSGWNWDPEHNKIFIEFQYEEEIMGRKINPPIRIEAPVIWSHKTRNKAEEVNWSVSLRVMKWLIKSLLETAYLWQSARTVAFLPYISTGREIHQTLAWKVLANLSKIQDMPALGDQREKVLDV